MLSNVSKTLQKVVTETVPLAVLKFKTIVAPRCKRSSSLKSCLQDIVTKNYSKVCQNASRQNSSIVAKSRRLPKRPVLRLFQNSTKTRRKPSELVESTFFKAPSFKRSRSPSSKLEQKRSRSPSMTSIFVAVFSKLPKNIFRNSSKAEKTHRKLSKVAKTLAARQKKVRFSRQKVRFYVFSKTFVAQKRSSLHAANDRRHQNPQ